MAFVTVLSAIVSGMLTFIMMLILTQPLLELRRVAQRISEGDLTSRARIWAKDEIGEVAQSVNLMIDQLVRGQQELEQTNRRLAAINRVAIAIGKQYDLREVLNVSLQTTLDVTGLPGGWITLSERDGNPYQLSNIIGLPPESEARLHAAADNWPECPLAESTEIVQSHACARLLDQ